MYNRKARHGLGMKFRRSMILAALALMIALACTSLACAGDMKGDLIGTSSTILPEDSRFGFSGIGKDWFDIIEMGFGWDRPHASWNEIEPTPGQYDWQRTDDYMKVAQSHGVQILFIIWPFADWDQSICHFDAPIVNDGFSRELGLRRGLPCDTVAYQAFVQALVERYDGDGKDDMPGLLYPVTHWEVSNEPDMTGPPLIFFQGTPADYVELLRLSSEAIRKADPQAKVVQGGASSAYDFMIDFWDDSFSLGAFQYFDISNVHSINGPEDLWTENWRALMNRHNVDKPYWVTEVQISSGNGYNRLSEEEQAEMIVKGFVEAFGNGAEKVFYTFFREDPYIPSDLSDSALIYADGDEKPAFYAMQTLIDKLRTFDSVEKLGQTSYKFSAKNNTIFVIWGLGTLPANVNGPIIVTDIYGKETFMNASDLRLSDLPVFIEPKASATR